MKLSVVCVIVCLALNANAAVVINGTCPITTIEQNFDTAGYLGLWYEYEKYPNLNQINGRCVTAEYSLLPNGTLGVLNTLTLPTGGVSQISGWGEPEDPSKNEGKFIIHFPSVGGIGNYWVVDTDYTSFSVVWVCKQTNPTQTEQSAWVLTRERFPNQTTIDEFNRVINSNNIPQNPFVLTDQQNC